RGQRDEGERSSPIPSLTGLSRQSTCGDAGAYPPRIRLGRRAGAQSGRRGASGSWVPGLRSVWRLDGAEIDVDALALGVEIERRHAVLAAEARHLGASEGHRDGCEIIGVDPDDT